MWAQLKDNLYQWKNKAKEHTRRRRNLKEQLRYYQNQNASLRAEIERLRAAQAPKKVKDHHYPAQMIAIAVFIVVRGGSLRVAAATAEFLAQLLGWSKYGCPSPTTVRTWVLRCGLHIVETSRNLQGDMVLIIDESIQLGREKLLLLLGVPLSENHSHCKALCGQDIKVLGMEVQSSWTSDWIVDFMERAIQRHPAMRICYVISDRGTSLLAAIKQLNLPWVSDCTHEMMNAVKQIFVEDAALSQLCAQIGSLRRRWTLTKWNILLPVTLRDKDRFHRIFTITEWAKRIDSYWTNLPRQVRQQLSFYRKSKRLINRLAQVRDLVDLSASILKNSGISSVSYQQWTDLVREYRNKQEVWSHAASKFVLKIDAYFTAHLALAHDQPRKRLLCCSDIIESTFGRYKNKGGMKAISADVLQIPLYHQQISVTFIQQALSSVKETQLLEWQDNYICHNFLGHRKLQDKALKNSRSVP